MITKINKIICAGLVGCGIAAALTACSDTWNEHYDTQTSQVNEGTLWQAIKQNPNLSNFASVAEACGYDKSLASSQVFTVFVPTNDAFSAEEAAELIAAYKAEKGKVNDDDNTTIKEFLQNHIAMYNHSVATTTDNDTITLMNGKYARLYANAIDESHFIQKNVLYNNGVMFVVDKRIKYFPNVFEYLRKDPDLDSVASFFYNPLFYRLEFQAEKSVAGGIVDGKTVYLDSVFRQQNDLFDYDFVDAELNEEDSTYWLVAPTNEEWRKLVDEYTNYFVYDPTVDKRDSVAYTNTRMAIMRGTAFSITRNPGFLADVKPDSAVTTWGTSFLSRQSRWGMTLPPHYYQYGDGFSPYDKPFQEGGVFYGADYMTCSNGEVLKSNNWNINPLQTFFQFRFLNVNSAGVLREVSKVKNTSTNEDEETITPVLHRVLNDNEFYGLLWDNSFVEYEQAKTTVNHSVTYNISAVLSNIGYDIYLVTAPALAADSNAVAAQRLPTKLRCTLSYHDAEGKVVEDRIQSGIENNPDIVDYLLLAEDYKFPVATWGLDEDETQVSLNIQTNVSSVEQRKNQYTRTMRINSVLLVPHGMSVVKDDKFYISFHGKGVWVLPTKPTSWAITGGPDGPADNPVEE
jgi:uncharacterized surface protein with fasciclin (FAS1) repeats